LEKEEPGPYLSSIRYGSLLPDLNLSRLTIPKSNYTALGNTNQQNKNKKPDKKPDDDGDTNARFVRAGENMISYVEKPNDLEPPE